LSQLINGINRSVSTLLPGNFECSANACNTLVWVFVAVLNTFPRKHACKDESYRSQASLTCALRSSFARWWSTYQMPAKQGSNTRNANAIIQSARHMCGCFIIIVRPAQPQQQ